MELVVELEVADGTEDIAHVLLLLEESDGVARSERLEVRSVHPSPVATEGCKLRIVVTDRTRGVELDSGTDSVLVGEAVVRRCDLHASVDG